MAKEAKIMPVKIGGGGKLQEYDASNGRYGKGSQIGCVTSPQTSNRLPSKPAKALLRKIRLDAKAAASDDPLLPGLYSDIQAWVPGCVMKVNEKYRLSSTENGEIDIETRRLVIEHKFLRF